MLTIQRNTDTADGEVVVDDVVGNGVTVLLLLSFRFGELDLPSIHHDHLTLLYLLQDLQEILPFITCHARTIVMSAVSSAGSSEDFTPHNL